VALVHRVRVRHPHERVLTPRRDTVASRHTAPCPQARRGSRDPATNALAARDRKSTRLNSSHVAISYAVFCLKKKKSQNYTSRRRLVAPPRCFFLLLRHHPLPPLFPYTTLFRSCGSRSSRSCSSSARTGPHSETRHGCFPTHCALSAGSPRIARSRHERAGCSRSEEHTSELESRGHLVCRLLLEKKKKSKLHLTTPTRCSSPLFFFAPPPPPSPSPLSLHDALPILWLSFIAFVFVVRPNGSSLRDATRLLPDTLRLVRRLAADRAIPPRTRWLL